jgi:hypothetical protein
VIYEIVVGVINLLLDEMRASLANLLSLFCALLHQHQVVKDEGLLQILRLKNEIHPFVFLQLEKQGLAKVILEENDLFTLVLLRLVRHTLRIVLQTGHLEQLDDVLVLP